MAIILWSRQIFIRDLWDRVKFYWKSNFLVIGCHRGIFAAIINGETIYIDTWVVQRIFMRFSSRGRFLAVICTKFRVVIRGNAVSGFLVGKKYIFGLGLRSDLAPVFKFAILSFFCARKEQYPLLSPSEFSKEL